MNLVDKTDKILRTKAQAIDFSNPPFDIDYIVKNMFEVMVSNKGIGLAGPQVGIPYQIIVIQINDYQRVIINPKILSFSEELEKEEEGCLSFPGLRLKVKRPKWVEVEYFDGKGIKHQEKVDGLRAKCFDHEIDHINGICFDTKVGKTSLMIARQKLKDKI